MSALEAYMEVVNTSVDPIFSNASNNDFVFYTATSNQSIHFGTQTGTAPSALTITQSNLAINGDLSLTRTVNIKGLKVSARSSASTPQNITSVVSSLPSLYPDGTDLTLKLTTPQTKFKFLNSNNTEIASITSTGVINAASNLTINGAPITLSDHTHDLTSSSITGVLPLTKGGTGISTATGTTGTGNIVLNSNPSFAGTVTLPTLTATSNATFSNNLSVIGDITLTKRVGLNGVFMRPRATAGALQNITTTVSSIPSVASLPNNVTFALSNPQSEFRFNNSNGTTTTTITQLGQVLAPSNDTSNAPAFSWTGDSDTGMYHASNDTIGFTCGGSNVMTVSRSNVEVNGNIRQFGIGVPYAACIIIEERHATTPGYTAIANDWAIRRLNTLAFDYNGSAIYTGTIPVRQDFSSTFMLKPGTYLINAYAPAYNVNQHRCRLVSLPTANVVAYGTSMFATGSVNNASELSCIVTTSSNTEYRLDHYTAAVASTPSESFGVSVAASNNTYAKVVITKLA